LPIHHVERSRVKTAEQSATRKPRPAELGAYVVYTLTDNMWELPWVRHLLSALPISHYESVDLWSPPVERLLDARVRRLRILLESLLPGPLRPTRHKLHRVLKPHDSSIFVYNTWGLDRAVREELVRLLSRLDDIGVVSVDEPTRDSPDTYTGVAFGVRVGFAAERYRDARNLLAVPLGVPKTFVPPQSLKGIRQRRFSWAFLGEVKNESRQNMVSRLRNVRGEALLHTTSGWDSADARRGSAYSDALADCIFAPTPPANVHLECYRTYEALECGAIPVVNTDYYHAEFGAPFPVVQPTWWDAPEALNRLLDDRDALERLDGQCREWWADVKQSYPTKIMALAEATKDTG
jgi:hypothetical protein